MKTESHSINDVLSKNSTSFFIPPFQRAYAWGKSEIERYFNDVIRIIESELDSEQKDKLEHFFGTLVIKEEKAGFANKSIIVDGQQRLTTTLIFLIALRDTVTDEDAIRHIDENYLTNNSSTFQDKIKLKQVTKDWDSYKALVNGKEANSGVIKIAYEYFTRLIKEKNKINPKIKFEHYITAIQRMNVAVIFLDERPYKGEDPQIIFETLNSLGKPLSLSDLIRNFILLKMDSESQSNVYENIWHPKIEEVFNDNTSKFFRDYLQYKMVTSLKVVSDNNTKGLYQIFKDYVNQDFENNDEFIDDILKYVKCYKWITTEIVNDVISKDTYNDKEIKELLRTIFHDIKTEAFKPFVLGLLEYHQNRALTEMTDDKLIQTLKIIRTYLIRRRIMGLGQGENKTIVTLSKKIADIANGNINMLDLLTNLIYNLRLPNDIELTAALKTKNFYKGLKKYSKLILGKIEENNTKVAVDFRNKKVTIEHVMPQRLTDDWRIELGSNYEEVYNTYLDNIGNLVLTEFNSEIGNQPFIKKKRILETSSLNYRLDIIKYKKWNEQSILDHQEKMIGYLLDTFPIPVAFRNTSNWNTNIQEKSSFSPLEIDTGELAGNKPMKFKIENNEIMVRTWQDVFISFLKYMQDSPNYDFDFIIESQLELFSSNETIIRWDVLKSMIDEESKVAKKYKTLDGKLWNKVKDLNDDLLFAHINISASRCMIRIANVMEKFNMSPESVMISLK